MAYILRKKIWHAVLDAKVYQPKRTTKPRLGQYPSMTLAEARLESSKMQLQLQQGEDPLATAH